VPDLGRQGRYVFEDSDYDQERHRDLPLGAGGSPIARIMGMSIAHLRSILLATGVASGRDIDGYIEASHNPEEWATYYATISVCGKKPAD
jgi:hypothetical protein